MAEPEKKSSIIFVQRNLFLPAAQCRQTAGKAEQTTDPLKLLEEAEAPFLGKYDEFISPDLLRKAFVVDGLDLNFFPRAIHHLD